MRNGLGLEYFYSLFSKGDFKAEIGLDGVGGLVLVFYSGFWDHFYLMAFLRQGTEERSQMGGVHQSTIVNRETNNGDAPRGQDSSGPEPLGPLPPEV